MTPLAAAAAALTLALTDGATAPPAGPVLTLDDALRRGAQANLDLEAARARLEQARAGVAKAWSHHLPQVTAGASYTRNSEAASVTLPTGFWVRDVGALQGPPAGQGVPGSPTTLAVVPSGSETADVQKLFQLGARVEVSQALLAPEAWFGIRAASEGAAAAERSVEAARREVLFGVAQAYYGTASLKKLVEVSQRLLEIARRQEGDAEARHRAGTIPRVGALRAEIDRVRAEQDLRRSRNAYASAKISLALLLDRDAAFEVADPPEPALPADLGALQASALRERPDVQAARLAQRAAESLRTGTSMRYLPALGAFGRWQASNVGGFTGRREVWAVGLGLTWNVLDGGLREADLRETRARAAEADAGRRAAEARAAAEVQKAILDLESAQANAEKAKEQAALAAENQRLVDAGYRAGAATAVEQADATATYRNAAVAATTETLQAQLAALRVLKAAGTFDPVRGS
jgi:outer membrane protein TolC